MHEVSLALSLLTIIENTCREKGCRSVESVRVRVGKAAGVLPDAFSFAFDAVKVNTRAKDARFLLEEVPLGGLCGRCGQAFVTEEAYILECPRCASTDFRITQGRELELVELEVDEAGPDLGRPGAA